MMGWQNDGVGNGNWLNYCFAPIILPLPADLFIILPDIILPPLLSRVAGARPLPEFRDLQVAEQHVGLRVVSLDHDGSR
ncbi:hypothetical protein TBK1r_70620 [Stieleria magnilauensis]|uniref:Uncharacterized protein n=1 Tax=Stieleria magnilauensis TaxID=2527963 RepID=A0ABX5Y4B3_9BACT|nr:hypothetical protein TBK1r_70620 [Planctomycetes bacterium TBK1r]